MNERIQKVLARANVASRRKVEEMILSGMVRLNGKKVTQLGTLMNAKEDVVHVGGKLILTSSIEEQEKVYLLLNKPRDVVTTASDTLNRKTVLDLLPAYKNMRLFPVGRLDYDAQGALLLTNDGEFSQKLIHPKFKIPKVYLVKVKGYPKESDIDLLRRGIYLEDGPTGPSTIELHRQIKNNSWYKVTLTKGKYRQIKRMFFRIEHPVMRIMRIEFAGIPLGTLEVGEYRQLLKKEIASLKENF